jgi:hypothetical protein
MSKVRMQAPDGATGMSVEGFDITTKDGFVDVDPRHVDILRSHGYSTMSAMSFGSSRMEMVRSFSDSARTTAESMSDEELRQFLAVGDEKTRKFWDGMKEGIRKYPAHVHSEEDEDDDPKITNAQRREQQESKAQREARDRAEREAIVHERQVQSPLAKTQLETDAAQSKVEANKAAQQKIVDDAANRARAK